MFFLLVHFKRQRCYKTCVSVGGVVVKHLLLDLEVAGLIPTWVGWRNVRVEGGLGLCGEGVVLENPMKRLSDSFALYRRCCKNLSKLSLQSHTRDYDTNHYIELVLIRRLS